MTPPRTTALVVALFGVALAAAPAAAQSLAEVARKAEERRAETKAPAKTYTNGNLTPDFTTPVTPAASASALEPAGELRRDPAVAAPGREGGPAAPTNSSPATASPTPPEAVKEEPPDEAYWRRYAKALRARVEEAQKALANAPRPASNTERELARVEEYLTKAKANLTRAQNDWQLFEMQANVAKVPKAWIQ